MFSLCGGGAKADNRHKKRRHPDLPRPARPRKASGGTLCCWCSQPPSPNRHWPAATSARRAKNSRQSFRNLPDEIRSESKSDHRLSFCDLPCCQVIRKLLSYPSIAPQFCFKGARLCHLLASCATTEELIGDETEQIHSRIVRPADRIPSRQLLYRRPRPPTSWDGVPSSSGSAKQKAMGCQ